MRVFNAIIRRGVFVGGRAYNFGSESTWEASDVALGRATLERRLDVALSILVLIEDP